MRRPVRPALAWLALCLLVTGLSAFPSAGPWMVRDKVPPPLRNTALNRILTAERVVVGKVRAIENEVALAAHAPRDLYFSPYRLAVVDIKETIVGPADEKTIRVGFRPVHLAAGRHLELKPGDEACFFLTRHPDQPFFVMTVNAADSLAALPARKEKTDLDIVRRGSSYEQDLALVRRCRDLLAEPKKGLQAANPEDRLITAALLVIKYRTSPPFNPGFRVIQEPIDADENQLILRILAEADLSESSQGTVSALGVFLKLNPSNFPWASSASVVAQNARVWLKANANTYQIKRYVAVSTANPVTMAKQPGDRISPPSPTSSSAKTSPQSQQTAMEVPRQSPTHHYAAIFVLGGVSVLMTACTLALLFRGRATPAAPTRAALDSTTAP